MSNLPGNTFLLSSLENSTTSSSPPKNQTTPIEFLVCSGSLLQTETSSRSSAGRSDSFNRKFWCTHMAHFSCVFASFCACFVWVLLVLCKELFGVLEGIRIPPPPLHPASSNSLQWNELLSRMRPLFRLAGTYGAHFSLWRTLSATSSVSERAFIGSFLVLPATSAMESHILFKHPNCWAQHGQ